VVVLCESIADGRELELRYGIPFIHSQTKNKLRVLRAAKNMVLSRIGDAGISVPHCEVTIDHSGLFGSRIQSLQRLGRLMHSDRAQYHCILMTSVERHERFAARVEAIKRSDAASCVLIKAERGMGKERALSELARQARARGLIVLPLPAQFAASDRHACRHPRRLANAHPRVAL